LGVVWVSWFGLLNCVRSVVVGVVSELGVYFVVASALIPKAVIALYKIRSRKDNKPCIVLCSSVSDLPKIGIIISKETEDILKKITPNPVSIILPCPRKKFEYLHRGGKSLAIRIPNKKNLREFLKNVGPVLAPSANLEGQRPARNIKEARNYFGECVPVYVSGKVKEDPSTIIRINSGKIETIRKGSWKVPKDLI
jgi:L-threonylcarbamoyladenylate synthase